MRIIAVLLSVFVLTFRANSQNEPKTGFTSVEYLISKLPEVKKISDDLEKQKKQYDILYDQKVKNFQEKLTSYQKSGANLPEIIKKDKEKELETLQTSIQELQQKAQKDLSEKQAQMIQPLYLKVYGAIQTVAEANGYKFIFNTGDSNQMRHLLVAPSDGDISELVLKQLGANAKEEAKTKDPKPENKKEVKVTNSDKPTPKKPAAKAPVKKKK
jgi:outer membrane protein